VVLACSVYILLEVWLSSGSCEPTHHIPDNRVQVHSPDLAIGRDPRIKLGASDEDLAPDPIAGQGMCGVLEMRSQRADAEPAVVGDRLEREKRVQGRADSDVLGEDSTDLSNVTARERCYGCVQGLAIF